MTDNVVPFRRRGTPPPPTDPQPSDLALSASSRRAAPGARALAAEQLATERARYAKARNRQNEERLLREGTPVPARITMALDLGGHEGPEVDIACGTAEPMVDLWECGIEVPNADQVKLLGELTGFPVAYFYEPIEPGPLLGGDGRMVICWGGRRGCEFPERDVVDEHGVLHYGGERRQPPKGWNGQGAMF